MHTVLQDVRYGIRQLFRQRGSSFVAVLTLALGIGLSSALFSVIDATMLRPLPYPHPEQLVEVNVEVTQPDGRVRSPTPSMEDMRTWQAAGDVFSAVAGWGLAFRGRIVDTPEPKRLEVMHFTEDYLSMYGVTPLIGRAFTRADCELESPLVGMLGYGFWQSQYGGRPDVLGTTIRLDDDVATIVGVLPSWFNARTPIAIPLRVSPSEFSRRGTGRVSVDARLRPGISLDAARAQLTARMASSNSAAGPARPAIASQLEWTTSRYRTTINVFVGAVALIVLLAAVNVAGLLLARGAARQAELDVRASLGASRSRLFRQLLTESVVLALPAGAIGVALAWVALDAIVANIPLAMPSNSPVRLNVSVLAATMALLLVTAIVAGLVPAIRLSRANVGRVMAGVNRQVGSTLSRRGGQMLIGAEVALAVVLVAGAGLMLRSYWRLAAVDLGFNPEGVVTMEVLPITQSPAGYKDYYATLLQQLRTIPGVSSVGLVDNFPLGGGTAYTGLATAVVPKAFGPVFGVMPGYFEAIGARLLEGRLLTEADDASQFRGVVINQSAARLLFQDQPAVGRELTRTGNPNPWVVVGVIADLRHGGPLGREQDRSHVFFPFDPNKSMLTESMMVVVRSSQPSQGLADQMRRIAQAIGPRVLIEDIRTADALFSERVAIPRRRMVLLTLLGSLGLVLALVGVFGTTAYAVARRTREIGLRLAVGARPAQVVGSIVGDSAVPIALGTAIGVAAAAMMTRVIESFLFDTAPRDPATLTAVAMLLMIAGALAAFVPALRAANIDPASTLRAE